jgi:hypothetical protein
MISSRGSFADVLACKQSRPRSDIRICFQFRCDMAAPQTEDDLVGIMSTLPALLEFIRFDLGDVVRKRTQDSGLEILRLIAGNPLVMNEWSGSCRMLAPMRRSPSLLTSATNGVHLIGYPLSPERG